MLRLDSAGQNSHAVSGESEGGVMGGYSILYIIGALVVLVVVLRLLGII